MRHPLSILIKPASSLCNMRCAYCFYHDVAENRHIPSYGIMKPEITEKLIKECFVYADSDVTFSFQGGEPTLAGLSYFLHFTECVHKYNTKHVNVHYTIQTNGYALDNDFCQFLADNNFLVGVSLDGTAQLHDKLRKDVNGQGTFKNVNETIKRLERLKITYNILCVVTDLLAQHGAEVYKYFRGRHFSCIQFIPQVPDFGEVATHTLSNKRYAQFLITTFRYYYEDFCKGQYISIRQFDNYVRILGGLFPECCGMDGLCHTNLIVESDGSVYPCDFYVLDEWRLGNIEDLSVQQLLSSETAGKFEKASYETAESCKTCNYYGLCRGGCRRHRESCVGSKLEKNRYCEAHKMFFSSALPQLRDLAVRVFNGN